MNAKDYAAEWKWMNTSPEAKQRSAAAKAHALSEFKKRFPRADMSKFIVQAEFDSNRKATARVLFLGERANRRQQVLVAASQRRFGNATRWWLSLSAITAGTKQAPASPSNCFL